MFSSSHLEEAGYLAVPVLTALTDEVVQLALEQNLPQGFGKIFTLRIVRY
jgi:hypothetical protein